MVKESEYEVAVQLMKKKIIRLFPVGINEPLLLAELLLGMLWAILESLKVRKEKNQR
jgi:hypothetical protein